MPQWGPQLCSDHLSSIPRAGACFKEELSSDPKPKGAVTQGLHSATGDCCNSPLGEREAPEAGSQHGTPCPWGSAVPLCCCLARC